MVSIVVLLLGDIQWSVVVSSGQYSGLAIGGHTVVSIVVSSGQYSGVAIGGHTVVSSGQHSGQNSGQQWSAVVNIVVLLLGDIQWSA